MFLTSIEVCFGGKANVRCPVSQTLGDSLWNSDPATATAGAATPPDLGAAERVVL